MRIFRSKRGYIQHRRDYSKIVSILVIEMMIGREVMDSRLAMFVALSGRETERVLLAIDLTSWRIGTRVVELDVGINKAFSLEMGGSKGPRCG